MTHAKRGVMQRRGRGLMAAANVGAMMAVGILATDAARAQVIHEDCTFTHGAGSMAPIGGAGVLITFNGGHAVLDCTRFDVTGPDGGADFVGIEGPNARFLLRVTGTDAFTLINGPLNSTGVFYLVNPAGVVFGPDSRVVAPGVYAAAGDIDISQYLEGNSIFDTREGGVLTVEEGGQILAQEMVHLIGQQVANHGAISAAGAFSGGGVVTMVAAQDTITISEGMDGRISVRIGMDELTRNLTRGGSGVPDLSGDVGVENTGSINVNGGGGQVVLGAGTLTGLAIANRGTIEARDGGSVQMTALAGTVYHSGTIQASDLAATGDAIQLDTNIQADVAQFNDAVYVGGDVTIGGLDGDADEVRFVSTVDGTSPGGGEGEGDGAAALDVQSDLTRFEGTVGAQQRLDSVNVSGSSVVSGDILTSGNASFGGAVDANGSGNQRIDSANGEVDFDGNVAKSTVGDLTMRGRTILVGGDMSTFAGDFDFDGETLFDGGALQIVTVSGGFPHEIRFSGNARKMNEGTLRLVGRDILFDAAAGIDQMLTALDALDIDGRIARSMAGDLLFDADTIAFGGSFVRSEEGDLAIMGAATFDRNGDQEVRAGGRGTVGFASTVSKTTAGDLALAGQGGISIPGNVDVAGGSLVVEDNLAFGGTSVATSGTQTYEGNVTLGDDATFAGVVVSFDEDVDGAGNDLTVNGAAVFGDTGDLDRVVGVNDLLVTGTTVVNAVAIDTTGTQTYQDEVTLGTDVTMAGTAVAFNGEIDGNGNDLTVNAATTSFGGEVSGVAHLETDAAGTTFIAANISVTDGVRFNDAVVLQNNVSLVDGSTTGVVFASTVDGGFAFSVRTDGDALFQADIGSVTALGSIETAVQGTLILQGSLVRASGDIVLNELVSIEVPATATIGAAGNLSIESLNGSFRMGQNQKLTVLGNLSISALNQAALGDINTLGNLSVSAADIVLILRDGSVIATPAGNFVTDQGVDFVAGGQFFFSVAPRAVGDGFAQFAGSNINSESAATLRSFVLRSFGGTLTPEQLQPGSGPLAGTFLDLQATGVTNASLAEAFDATDPDADDGDALSEAILPALIRNTLAQNFAVVPRDLRTEELNDLPAGRAIYLDSPETGVAVPIGGAVNIAVNRLERQNAFKAVALWHQLTGYDAATGNSSRPPADIARDVAQFWNDYAAAIGSDPSPSGVAASLPASLTNELVLLIAVLDQIRLMGLTNTEMQTPLNAVVAQFTPDEIGVPNMRAILAALR